ncbi:MAG: hypothetical protein II385_06945 [Bacteroidaceae bacterium]|jgi:hypothetical protein|nr:hypothetical protein [Bacteroidaceae bacterium]
MCKYIKAQEGHYFRITDKGKQDPRVSAKFEIGYIGNQQYKYRVPENWIRNGLVEEVTE